MKRTLVVGFLTVLGLLSVGCNGTAYGVLQPNPEDLFANARPIEPDILDFRHLAKHVPIPGIAAQEIGVDTILSWTQDVIVALAVRKTVVAPRWPFCARCQHLRSRRLKTGLGLLGAAVAMPVISIAVAAAVTNDDTVAATILIIGNALMLAGIVAGSLVLVQSTWRAVAGVVVSPDGLWVSVPSPSQAFGTRTA